jgi:hypothetical protein
MKATDLTRANKNTIIYLDMDGVLADFFTGYQRVNPKVRKPADIPLPKEDETLPKLVGTNFYYTLPKYKTADELVRVVLQYVDTYGICSSPLRGDAENAELNKRKWIGMNLTPKPNSNNIIITSDKPKFAVQADGTPNVLIDDKPSNITRWIAAGGIGINYNADVDAPAKVDKALGMVF